MAASREFSGLDMLCEKCQEREAVVHITATQHVPPTDVDKHHFCEECAESSPLANPKRNYGPDVIDEQFRVVRVMDDSIVVRLVRTESQNQPAEWTLLRARVPEQHAVVGAEFGIICSPEELEKFRTKR